MRHALSVKREAKGVAHLASLAPLWAYRCEIVGCPKLAAAVIAGHFLCARHVPKEPDQTEMDFGP